MVEVTASVEQVWGFEVSEMDFPCFWRRTNTVFVYGIWICALRGLEPVRIFSNAMDFSLRNDFLCVFGCGVGRSGGSLLLIVFSCFRCQVWECGGVLAFESVRFVKWYGKISLSRHGLDFFELFCVLWLGAILLSMNRWKELLIDGFVIWSMLHRSEEVYI